MTLGLNIQWTDSVNLISIADLSEGFRVRTAVSIARPMRELQTGGLTDDTLFKRQAQSGSRQKPAQAALKQEAAHTSGIRSIPGYLYALIYLSRKTE